MSRHSPYREAMVKHVRNARTWQRMKRDREWLSEWGRAEKCRLLRDISIQIAWAHQHGITEGVHSGESAARSVEIPR